MKGIADLRNSAEFEALLRCSQRLGSDPLQVQGPGGNTSIKGERAMWIKASGTWLAEASSRDIMVPVDLAALRAAAAAGQRPKDACVIAEKNPGGLRASIETSVHAVFDWPVVLHTHCVATIAIAVRADAAAKISKRLDGIEACLTPYVKPGWDLAEAISARVSPNTRVLVLANHGLVVGGESVAEAEQLLRHVSDRLAPASLADGLDPAPELAERLAGTSWQAAPNPQTQAIALDPRRLEIANDNTLYPDHLVFLGPGVAVAREGESPDEVAERVSSVGPARKLILFPGLGAALPADASASVLALAGCLGDVLARIEPGVALNRLTPEQEAELLDWDAEKYRQALDLGSA